MNDFNLTTQAKSSIAPVRFEQTGPLLMAGLRELMEQQPQQQIPLLWQRFAPISQEISHRVDASYYGVCMSGASNGQEVCYMAACEVSEFVNVSPQLSQVILPSCNYAVFAHRSHVSELTQTVCAIFDMWLPNSDYQLLQQATNQLHHLERYTEDFNPQTGLGGMEILVPVKNS